MSASRTSEHHYRSNLRDLEFNLFEFLDVARTTLGKGDVDVPVQDPAASRLHALVERVAGGWIVSDLGSRNGTFVNGVRVTGPRALKTGDELRIGLTRLVFVTAEAPEELTVTTPLQKAPTMTPRERDALVALCTPILQGGLMEEPASVKDIAEALVVTESAAKKLLVRLYDRFELQDDDRRRGRLAMHAMQTGAVSIADVRER